MGAAEKRPLRASTWRVTARSPIGSAVKIGAAALPRVLYKSYLQLEATRPLYAHAASDNAASALGESWREAAKP